MNPESSGYWSPENYREFREMEAEKNKKQGRTESCRYVKETAMAWKEPLRRSKHNILSSHRPESSLWFSLHKIASPLNIVGHSQSPLSSKDNGSTEQSLKASPGSAPGS